MNKFYSNQSVVPPWTYRNAFGKHMVLRDTPSAGGDDEFETKVLDGVKLLTKDSAEQKKRTDNIQENITKMLTDVDRLDKQTKDVLKDMETHKGAANDTAEKFNTMVKRFALLDARLKLEAKASFGDPIKRLTSNESAKTRLNIAIRLAMRKDNDLVCVVNKIAEQSDESIRADIQDTVKRALSGDASPGSTIIDDTLSNEIYSTLQSFGTAWNTFQVVPVSTKSNKFAVQTARPVALVLAENAQIVDDANKTGTSVTCEAKIIAALLDVSISLLEDAETDLSGNLMEDFAEAYGYRMDWITTQADGTADSTDGGYTGVFGGGATAAAAAGGNITVETTDLEDWMRCLLTVDPAVLQRAARWWMHPQIVVRALAVRDSNGRPIFQNALEAPSAGAVGSILGYPVSTVAAAPTTNAANAKVAVFGDPRGLVVGMRRQYSFENSDHHKWDYFQRSYRGVGRAGAKIRAAGAFACLTLPAA